MVSLWNRDNYNEELSRVIKIGHLWKLKTLRENLLKADTIEEKIFILTTELEFRLVRLPHLSVRGEERQTRIIKSIKKILNELSEIKIKIQYQEERDETEVFRFYGLN